MNVFVLQHQSKLGPATACHTDGVFDTWEGAMEAGKALGVDFNNIRVLTFGVNDEWYARRWRERAGIGVGKEGKEVKRV